MREHSVGHRRVQFAQGLHGGSRSVRRTVRMVVRRRQPHSRPSAPGRFIRLSLRRRSSRTSRCRRLYFRLIRLRSWASAGYREAAPAQVTDGADRKRTLHRSPENRKVDGSTPSLATTSDQRKRSSVMLYC
jgi:hypothetical protein